MTGVMDMYSRERSILDRHQEMIRNAEEQSRLAGWQPRERMAVHIATQLRRLADRIEGRQPTKVWIFPG
jgi:hypothetical protein